MQCIHKPDIKTCLNRIPLCKKCKAQIMPQRNYKYIFMKVFEYGGILGVALTSSYIKRFYNNLCMVLGWQDSVYAKVVLGVFLCLVCGAAASAIEVLFKTHFLDYQTIKS